jgi:hypothetical protein
MSPHDALLIVILVAGACWFVTDWKKGAEEARRMYVADGIRKLRERAEAIETENALPTEFTGYRAPAVCAEIEDRPGFVARMRARHRARQQLAMEKRLSRPFR